MKTVQQYRPMQGPIPRAFVWLLLMIIASMSLALWIDCQTHRRRKLDMQLSQPAAGPLSSSDLNSGSYTPSMLRSDTSKPPVRLFVGVLSAPDHVEARQTIRETWGSDVRLARVMFFVLRPRGNTAFRQLRQEAVTAGDVVITSEVYTHYNHITYAVLDIFKSAAMLGNDITHVLKTDDDAYVRWSLLLPALEALPRKWLYAGAPMESGSVIRKRGWHAVSYRNWARDDPVPYGYGLGYIVSIDIAQHIAAGAPHVIMPPRNLLIIEDMAMGYWVDFIGKENNVDVNYRTIEHSLGNCTSTAMFWHVQPKQQSSQVIRCMHARQGRCCDANALMAHSILSAQGVPAATSLLSSGSPADWYDSLT